MRKPFRAAKPYWASDETVDVHENNFDVWVKEDGVTPLSATSRRRPKVPYWEFARDQARHLVTEAQLRPGHHYALTEVVHCKSREEAGVEQALATCADRYLAAVLARSPATVVVVAGKWAARAIERIFGVPREQPATLVGPTAVAGAERLLLYLPHPGWVRRNPERAEAVTLPSGIPAEQLEQLRAAVAAASASEKRPTDEGIELVRELVETTSYDREPTQAEREQAARDAADEDD